MTNKKLEDIKPFMIDCTVCSKEQVVKIFDKMFEAGIPVEEAPYRADSTGALKSYEYDSYPCWGYIEGHGTHTNERGAFPDVPYITLDQLDDHLGLTTSNPPQELRNVMIDLRKESGTVDKELSKAFQEAVFASGGHWSNGNKDFFDIDGNFLFVDAVGEITWSFTANSFKADNRTQITFTYERKLEWTATVVEQEPERDIIELPSGDKYYADELEAALGMIKKID